MKLSFFFFFFLSLVVCVLKAIALAHRGKDVNNQMIMTTKAQKLYCATRLPAEGRKESKLEWSTASRVESDLYTRLIIPITSLAAIEIGNLYVGVCVFSL